MSAKANRRDFITLLGGAAAWPIAASGQSSIPVIGFINGSSATAYAAYVQAFIRGLAETGHTVGENVAIEYRWAEGHYDRIPDMDDDLVRRRVAVLAPNTPATHAAKRAAGNIPVVFFTGEDPVASGLVASLNRPGGNVTGVTSLFGGLAAKQVGLLRDLVPAATLIGFLVNPRNPITERNVLDALDAGQKVGEKIEIVHASSETEIDAAFDTLRGIRASGFECAEEIGVLLARHRPDEAAEAKPRLECVGADERCAKQDQEAVEEPVVLDEIARHHRIWHRSGEQLLDEAVPHGMRPAGLACGAQGFGEAFRHEV